MPHQARSALMAGLVLLSSTWGGSGIVAADTAWPSSISTVYKVVVAGFELGTFRFRSTLEGGSYALTGDADLSWGFGMFGWSSRTHGAGTVAGDQVEPAAYTLDYKTNARAGSVKMTFSSGDVSHVSIVPPSPVLPGTVPLKEHHLKRVFDPLSALMALSRGSASNPCGKRISIFDGKLRFDLALSFRRQERIDEKPASGQPALVYVCRIQYLPVAGYQPSADTQSLASNNGIEVAMRPVPSANILVPQRVVIPTAVGNAELVLQRADIMAPGNRAIKLRHD